MMIYRIVSFVCFLMLSLSGWAQKFYYQLDLKNIIDDKVKVRASIPQQKDYTVFYHFPHVVPGTYAIEDYGKYIENFQAFDKEGKLMEVKKQGYNTYIITDATQLKSITYLVNDAMDMVVKENSIFQPASTNIDSAKNVLLNNGGFFGYIENQEASAIEIECLKPDFFYGSTSLEHVSSAANKQVFKAQSYHQLVDCPMLFCRPDTISFLLNNTKVSIACYDVQGKSRAASFYNLLKADMTAIAKFLPVLPVDRYTFLIFIDDKVMAGNDLSKQNGLFRMIKTAYGLRKLALGALEHGNSSTYYLADFGEAVKVPEIKLDKQLTGAAIHEFMHIITPLGLHSERIGNFNYQQPLMSKHLWLYEGITEYFANLIKLQGGLLSPAQFFAEMKSKIKSGRQFPNDKMSFTEMSEHVLEKSYHKQYNYVYTRGAVLAWLLDLEILRLSQGRKSLKDVVLQLNKKFGPDKSFAEDQLFAAFSAAAGVDLSTFFEQYIEGKQEWPLDKALETIGVSYFVNQKMKMPRNPFDPEQNDIKYILANRLVDVDEAKIKSIGKEEWAGLQAGDKIKKSDWYDLILKDGQLAAENQIVKVKVKRGESNLELPITIKYQDGNLENYLGFSFVRTPKQIENWKLFSASK